SRVCGSKRAAATRNRYVPTRTGWRAEPSSPVVSVVTSASSAVRTSIALPGSGRRPFSVRTTIRISPVPGLKKCTAEYAAPVIEASPARRLITAWNEPNDAFPTTSPVHSDSGAPPVSQPAGGIVHPGAACPATPDRGDWTPPSDGGRRDHEGHDRSRSTRLPGLSRVLGMKSMGDGVILQSGGVSPIERLQYT